CVLTIRLHSALFPQSGTERTGLTAAGSAPHETESLRSGRAYSGTVFRSHRVRATSLAHDAVRTWLRQELPIFAETAARLPSVETPIPCSLQLARYAAVPGQRSEIRKRQENRRTALLWQRCA